MTFSGTWEPRFIPLGQRLSINGREIGEVVEVRQEGELTITASVRVDPRAIRRMLRHHALRRMWRRREAKGWRRHVRRMKAAER